MIQSTRILSVFQVLIVAMAFGLNSNSIAQDGNADVGKQKSASCTACHGADGNSLLDQFPKIAGQVPGYVANQLHKFQSKTRDNAIMMGIVGSLSDEDMADLDAYYASQAMSAGSVSADQEEQARAGEAIYRGGIAKFSVPACMSCHGPSGSGIAPNFPRLAGQHAAYIEAQLQAFKSGARPDPIMQTIAFPLSDEQIKQLALYISALH